MLIAALAVMALIVAVGILVTWLFMRGEKNPGPPTSSSSTDE
jgi:hypothetical protein